MNALKSERIDRNHKHEDFIVNSIFLSLSNSYFFSNSYKKPLWIHAQKDEFVSFMTLDFL